VSVESVVELRGVSRHFGRRAVLRGLDFRLVPGETVGIVGPNGAGKTTFLSIVVGLSPMDEGERWYFGVRRDDVDVETRGRLAYVGHAASLYPGLSARENLELFADLRSGARARVLPSLARMGLADATERPVAGFSRGMIQRAALARALQSEAEVLVLDEPFTALDAEGRDCLVEVLHEERRRGAAVIVTSHDLDTLARVCDRVLLLDAGRFAVELRAEDHGGDPSAFSAAIVRASRRA
jgi:heme ABC exporter ATP-binding subunit CcmA